MKHNIACTVKSFLTPLTYPFITFAIETVRPVPHVPLQIFAYKKGGPDMFSPLSVLSKSSSASLQELELKKLNNAANLRKQLHALHDQLVQEQAEALLARWLIEDFRARHPEPYQDSFDFVRAIATTPMYTRNSRGRFSKNTNETKESKRPA